MEQMNRTNKPKGIKRRGTSFLRTGIAIFLSFLMSFTGLEPVWASSSNLIMGNGNVVATRSVSESNTNQAAQAVAQAATSTQFLQTSVLRAASNEYEPKEDLIAADVTDLPNSRNRVRVAPGNNPSSVSYLHRGLRINYDTKSDGWAGGGFVFDKYYTHARETIDLNHYKPLRIGLKGDSSRVKIEFVDDYNFRQIIYAEGVRSDKELVWEFPVDSFTQIDRSKLREIIFVVEGNHKKGKLEVSIEPKRSYGVYLNADSRLTSADLTELPKGQVNNLAVPSITSVSSSSVRPTSVAATERGIRFNYQASRYGWGGPGYTYDHFGTEKIETKDLSNMKEFVFGIKSSSYWNKVEIVDAKNRKAHVYLRGASNSQEKFYRIPTSHFEGIVDLSQVRLIYFVGHSLRPGQGQIEVNHKPEQELMPVPQGWTKTSSNPNYAYRVGSAEPQGGRPSRTRVLDIIDLRTGEKKRIDSRSEVSSAGVRISSTVDISPENTPGGPVIVYEASTSGSGTYVFSAYARRLSNLSQLITLSNNLEMARDAAGDGYLKQIRFYSSTIHVKASSRYWDGTEMNETRVVRFSDLKETNHLYTLIKKGSNAKLDPSTGYLMVGQTGRQYRSRNINVFLFKAANSANTHFSFKRKVAFEVERETYTRNRYPFFQSKNVSGVGPIASIGLEVETSASWQFTNSVIKRKSGIVNVNTGEELFLDGTIQSLTYQGSIGTYTLLLEDGTTTTVKVDLKKLEVVEERELPEGFELAKSNEGFAFRVGSNGDQSVLELLDVSKFQRGDADAIRQLTTGSRAVSISSIRDVSSAGYVVYGISANATGSGNYYIQKADGSGSTYAARGLLRGLTFVGNNRILPEHVDGGQQLIHTDVVSVPSFQRVDRYARVNPALAHLVHQDKDAKVALYANRLSNGTVELVVYDANAGENRLRRVDSFPITADSNLKMTYMEAWKASNGRRIAAGSVEGTHVHKSVLVDVATEATIDLGGSIQSVTITNDIARIAVNRKDGKQFIARVDLRNFRLISFVPVIIDFSHYLRDVQTEDGVRKIYSVTSRSNNHIVIYNPANHEVKQYHSQGFHNNSQIKATSGKYIIYAGYLNRVYVAPLVDDVEVNQRLIINLPQPENPSVTLGMKSARFTGTTTAVITRADDVQFNLDFSTNPPTLEEIVNEPNVIEVKPGESVEAALSRAKSGDIVRVYPGTYTGNFRVREGVTLEGVVVNGQRPVLKLKGYYLYLYKNAAVKNFTMQSTSSNRTAGIYVSSRASGTTIDNIHIDNGFLYIRGEKSQILNSVIKRKSGSALYLYNGNNVVRGNVFQSKSRYGYVVIVYSYAKGNNLIDGNTIVASGITDANTRQYGIYVYRYGGMQDVIKNTIIAGANVDIYSPRLYTKVEYSLLQKGRHYGRVSFGKGIVKGKDPLFVNASAGNFSLQMASPAINAGDPNGGRPDLGAVQYSHLALTYFDKDKNRKISVNEGVTGITSLIAHLNARGSDARFDVNGDGNVTPLDVLILINFLNALYRIQGGAFMTAVEAAQLQQQLASR